MRRRSIIGLILGLLFLESAAAEPLNLVPIDCEGPAGDPEPGSAGWLARDAVNMYCAEQRHLDKTMHSVTALPVPGVPYDAYRQPDRYDGVRFRFQSVTAGGLAAELYRPCAANTCPDMPAGLQTFEPPYPALLVLPGGAARKELYWWGSQPLAESGYMVLAIDPSATIPSMTDVESALGWLLGADNPYKHELDAARVGIAGHSTGGALSSYYGQADARLSAAVEWDRGPNFPLPQTLATPELFLTGDYGCQVVPVCQPMPRLSPSSNPVDGPWDQPNANPDFERLRIAGTDSMKISIRAALHLDWVPTELAGNRYVESVTNYYTLAWFDRYLKGKIVGSESEEEKAARRAIASDAYRRLTAATFDDSADRHNVSQGLWDPGQAALSADPLYGGNVPYTITGMPVADRLSFYFFSRCFITDPTTGVRANSDDMRSSGCPANGT